MLLLALHKFFTSLKFKEQRTLRMLLTTSIALSPTMSRMHRSNRPQLCQQRNGVLYFS